MKALFRKIIDAIKDDYRKGTRCPDCDVKWVKTNTFFESMKEKVNSYQCPQCGKKLEIEVTENDFSDYGN